MCLIVMNYNYSSSGESMSNDCGALEIVTIACADENLR